MIPLVDQDTNMSKRNLIIISSVVAALAIIFLFVYYFYRPAGKLPGKVGEFPIPGEEIPGVKIPPALKAISNQEVLTPTLSVDGTKILYFDKKAGQLFQNNFDGSGQERMGKLETPNLVKAVWSKDKTKAIEVFSAEGELAKILYDFTTQKTTPLNKDITDFAFGGDNQFAYYLDNQLYLSNSDYNKVDPLYPIKIGNLRLVWPALSAVEGPSKIYITTPASDFADGVLFSLDPIEKILLKVLSAPALLVNYSSDGAKILYSTRADLFIADSSGKNPVSLPLSTLANKCVFSNDSKNLYCAVPQSLPEPFVLDEYYQGLVEFTDEFWKIDPETGGRSLLRSSEENLDAQNLIISPAEDYLMFVNQKDGKLYSLRL